MAIIDISDNVNKMGGDLSSLRDAYGGFSRGNFTMLDNLKLGYSGTKEEMQRLLKDAEKLSGMKFDISSYADMVQAIHIIQENMGIAGTTAKESSETISGSWASMKSAWSNTLTALILGGDDFDRSLDNLVDSAKTFGKNIMPAIRSSLEGVGKLITELAPTLEKELPGIIKTLLPPLLKAATSLVKGLIVALPDIVKTIASELPTILSELWGAIKEAFGDVPGLEKAETFFKTIKKWCTENADFIKATIPAIVGLVGAFKLFNTFKGLSGLFGGGSGSSGGGFFGSLAKIKTSSVLKGIGNIAIIVGGLAGLSALLMWAAPYMAQLSDVKSITEVLGTITAVGLIGTGMTQLAASVGNIPVATVAKGLANIAIVMVGFGTLAAVLMWVAPYMAQLSDMRTTMQMLLVIGATGLVGSALAGLAGLVGAIPIPTVLAGLANIALALGGFSAVAVAFGALTKVDGFTELLNDGGKVLGDLCGIIGNMAGELVGGALAGLSDGLATIGTNISAFATAVAPAFETFSSINTTGISDFASALGSLMGVLVGDAVLSFFTGGKNYAEFGTKLSDFATNASTFFTTVKDIPDESFGKMTSLFNALSGVQSLPKEGGIVGFFEGEVDFDKLANGVKAFGGVQDSILALKDIPADSFSKMTSLFDALAGVDSLPKDGGVMGWFEGEIAFDKLASGIASFASDDMIEALGKIQDISADGFTQMTSLFNALAGVKALPKSGGISQLFSGDISFDNLADGLKSLTSDDVIAAFTAIKNIPTEALSNLTALFTALGGIKALPQSGGIAQLFSGEVDFANLASGLTALAGEEVAAALTGLGKLPTESLPNLTALFSALGEIKALPKSGGIAQLFAGEVNFTKLADGLKAFGGEDTVAALNALESVSTTSFEHLAALFGALGGVEALPASGGIAQLFTGEVDFGKLATGLAAFGDDDTIAALGKIEQVSTKSFDNLTALFNALGGISSLPTDGGIQSWFSGEVKFDKLADGLKAFTSDEMITALENAGSMSATGLTNLTLLFNALAGIGTLPTGGGIQSWFTGEIAFDKIADGLQKLSSDDFITAITKIQNIPAAGFTALTSLFNALAGINALPDGGGIFDWFTGDSTTGLTEIASALPGVATNIKSFFDNLGGRVNFAPIKNLFNTLSDIKIDSDAASKGFLGLGKSDLEKMGDGLSSFATKAKTFFDTINALDTTKLTSFLDGLGTASELPTTLSTLDDSVGTSLSNMVTNADTKLTELKGKFSDNLGAIVILMNTTATTMYSSGQAIMQGVNNGMNSMRGRLIATARSMAAAIQSAFNVKLDINSPSREGFKSGVFVGEGIDLGMQSKIPDLQATATRMGSASIPYASRYTPTSDSTTVYNSRTSSEYTTISPSFNLTISGTQDDRATARKVKRWVNDAVQDIFESMERKSYVTS